MPRLCDHDMRDIVLRQDRDERYTNVVGARNSASRSVEGGVTHRVAVVLNIASCAADEVPCVEISQQRVQVEGREREVDGTIVQLIWEGHDLCVRLIRDPVTHRAALCRDAPGLGRQ